MKKFWFAVIALLLLFGFSFAWSQQTTPNLGLVVQTPPPMPNNWSAIINYDLWKIDGAALDYTNLYQGAWSSTVMYTKSAMVTHSGTLYVSAINGNLNLTPGVSGSWIAAGGGGGTLPSGLKGQILYYAADGTTVTPTDKVFYNSVGNELDLGDTNEGNSTKTLITSYSDAPDTGEVDISVGGDTYNDLLSLNANGVLPNSGNIMMNAGQSTSGVGGGTINIAASAPDPASGGTINLQSSGPTTFTASNWALDTSGNVTFNGTGCSSGTYVKSDGTGCGTPGGGASWGAITGTLSAQTDLQSALNAKWNTPTFSNVVALWASGTCSGYLKSDGTCDAGGASSVNVNGSSVASPNFNGTTPAAPAGATNKTFAASGSNISAYDYSVQYQGSTVNNLAISDSRFATSSDTLAGTGAVHATAISGDGTTITVTGTNTLAVGDWVTFWWTTWSPSCVKASMAPVTSASGSQFTIDENRTFCTGVVSGTGSSGNDIALATNTVVPIMSKLPFFLNHGKQWMLLRQADGGGTYALWNSAYTANIHPFAPGTTGVPATMLIHLGYDDERNSGCPSLATLESQAQTLWTSLRSDGISIIESSEATNVTGDAVTCTGGTQILQQFNDWKSGQGPGAATAHWDQYIELAGPMGQSLNTALWGDANHYGNGGNYKIASLINNQLASQGSLNLEAIGQGRNILYGFQTLALPTGTSNADILGFARNGSTSADWTLGDVVGAAYIKVAGNLIQKWNFASTTASTDLPNNGMVGFLNGVDPSSSTRDTGISRDSAGVVDIGNGTRGDKSGTLNVANINVTGTCTGCLGTVPLSSVTAGSSPSGVFDFSGATQVKQPVAAGYASAANGEVGYDSTDKNWHAWDNGADTILIPFPTAIVSGDCYFPQKTGNTWAMVDAGGPCGVSGGGSAWSGLTSGTNTTAAMVVGSGASIDVTGTGTINATKIGGITITGTPSTGMVPTATSSSAATWQAQATSAVTNITASLTPTNCAISGNACVTSGAVASITLASVPSGYNGLRIALYGNGSAATTQWVSLQFNGDTGTNYDYTAQASTASAGPTKTTANGTATAYVCDIAATGSYSGGGEITIQQYAGTSLYKTARGVCGSEGPTAGFEEVADYSFGWRSTAAITSLKLTPQSGNFATGYTIVVYGIN